MQRHPYVDRPDFQFWKSASGSARPAELDPVVHASFNLTLDDRIVTAGSCFAQHLARHLATSGYNFHVTEPGHPLLSNLEKKENNYGVFTARYGNIYTARQLVQLLQRAYGAFDPIETVWQHHAGYLVDPFRPQVQPNGFVSAEDLAADQTCHLKAVRKAIEDLDVFVFTLGLTEAWLDRRDGAVYPLAPGVAGGTYDDAIHGFVNFGVEEVVADMDQAFSIIREKNPGARFLITVSPVPLNATALERHVLVSTTYSKSVLRVAAEILCNRWSNADYFPSYEIITAPHVRCRYFAADNRTVLEAGVEHVMRVFFRHYSASGKAAPVRAHAAAVPADDGVADDPHTASMERIVQAICDEEAISNVAT